MWNKDVTVAYSSNGQDFIISRGENYIMAIVGFVFGMIAFVWVIQLKSKVNKLEKKVKKLENNSNDK